MIIFRNFSQISPINTNNTSLGFSRGRKYDTDMDRFGRISTSQGELNRIGDLREEIRKMNRELNRGVGDKGKWQGID